MSIAFPLALVAAVIATVMVPKVLRLLGFKSPTIGCFAVAISFPVLCAICFHFMIWLGTSEGFDLTYDDVNGRVNLELPTQATHIDFIQHFHQICTVDFTVDEKEFLRWCRVKGWTLNEIDANTWVVPIGKSAEDRSPVHVKSGYNVVVVPDGGKIHRTVVYDKERQRAFYRFYTF